MSGHHRQTGCQIFAYFRGVTKIADPVDALWQTTQVHGGQVIRHFFLWHPTHQEHGLAHLVSSQSMQFCFSGPISNY